MTSSVVIPRVPGLRIGRCLGRGGMGAVFLAHDATGRELALKVIAGELAEDSRRRFQREIAALASVRNPHVVRLRTAGEVDGRPYALLERIVGRPLSRVRARSSATVADLGWQLARAIAAVHAAGWLHRDIKLGNALVSRRGFLTLIDLGLAKRMDDDGAPDDDITSLTTWGMVVGTPQYLAPEVRAGDPASAATDVYGLGVVLRGLFSSLREPPNAGWSR